jgi:hypothetical protein
LEFIARVWTYLELGPGRNLFISCYHQATRIDFVKKWEELSLEAYL